MKYLITLTLALCLSACGSDSTEVVTEQPEESNVRVETTLLGFPVVLSVDANDNCIVYVINPEDFGPINAYMYKEVFENGADLCQEIR